MVYSGGTQVLICLVMGKTSNLRFCRKVENGDEKGEEPGTRHRIINKNECNVTKFFKFSAINTKIENKLLWREPKRLYQLILDKAIRK